MQPDLTGLLKHVDRLITIVGMGYDPLHGIMPDGQISELLLYYGFLVFSLVTILYSKFVEKKKIAFIGLSGSPIEYLTGALVAAILLFFRICPVCWKRIWCML